MSRSIPQSIGFVGVGVIAASVIRAILNGPHAAGLDVVLSPRSAALSSKLADEYAQARVVNDNQAVVDESEVVFIAVLPDQIASVCAELTFREDQTIVSLAAGWPPSVLKPHVAPAAVVSQLIPLPMIELGVGPVVLSPAIPEIERLLQDCGEVVVLEHEEDILAFSCTSGTMSLYFELLNTIIDWSVEKHGIDADRSKRYMSALFHGLATQALHTDTADMDGLAEAHETPGGLNAYMRQSMIDEGVYTTVANHLETMYQARRPNR